MKTKHVCSVFVLLMAGVVFLAGITGCDNGTNDIPSFDVTKGSLTIDNIPYTAQGQGYIYLQGSNTGDSNKVFIIANTSQTAASPAVASGTVDIWLFNAAVSNQTPIDFEDGTYLIKIFWGPNNDVEQLVQYGTKVFEDNVVFINGTGTATLP
ncbi:MAG: hypothetical protein LBL58_17955 [Tannerellaceae bacterium]|jgi:hypothetical protein|nr:hypothetical protein [Tannerellaceae bacterium]